MCYLLKKLRIKEMLVGGRYERSFKAVFKNTENLKIFPIIF
jgi:hypothetical protein